MSKKDKSNAPVTDEEVQTKKESASKRKPKAEKIDPLTQLQSDLDSEKDRYLRLFAEFENYKKRTSRERIELFKTASQDVMVSLLPVIDDFDRALSEIEKANDDNLFKGVELISNKLDAIGTQIGDVFDAEIHEAITQIPSPEADLKGKIIDVIEKGYTLGDKIIRYPKVVIGQ
jgi:molecular chaperone GrpE